ncbi:3-phosphoshikimate 1-carboxyvinyltransferase [Candidatus Peregrinibacteria bacterium]|nr:3-phosphoshikimate 1-carboxyvinyltransferase [Candidatus Peregrinibacteria bacterium]
MRELSPFTHPFRGKISVPGSKSLTNRALLLAALAPGQTILKEWLSSEDTEVMITALREFGVDIYFEGKERELTIVGTSGKFQNKSDLEIFCANSGTSLRFLTAVSALRSGKTLLTGAPRMKKRPLRDLSDALSQMGVLLNYPEKKGFPPIQILGNQVLQGGDIHISGKTSSQFLSALLHIAPFAGNPVRITLKNELVSELYVRMTIGLLEKFGVHVRQNERSTEFCIDPQPLSSPGEVHIEGDATSATYPLGIALATQGSIIVQNICSNSLQGDAYFPEKVLKKMGAMVQMSSDGIFLTAPQNLLPLDDIHLGEMPDAAMTAVVLSALAKGVSRISGLSTLRDKECDRISALVSNLASMGANVLSGKDFIEVHGDPLELHGAEIETFHDHRIAMCFSILGAVIPDVRILHPECVEKTYPTYWQEYEEWRGQF